MAGMISTKGRYSLLIMTDLATHDGWVSLGDISQRLGISRKYLEQITSQLNKAGFLESQRGKGGGYKLARPASEYSVGAILRASEGPIAPVSCLDCTNDVICPKTDTCPTLEVWRGLGEVTNSYLNQKTLADIVCDRTSGDKSSPSDGPVTC